MTLAITLPNSDGAWLSSFSKGFLSLAKQYSMQLIGGDTTRGGLAISVTVMGLLPKGQSLKRSGAKVGDDIYVSGTIGNAGLGLIKAQKGIDDMSDDDLAQYLQPMPKINLGEQILSRATACIDISDGLSADLNHILTASGVGAVIEHNKLPMTETVKGYIAKHRRQLWPYSSGDDYQLCFTLPREKRSDEDMLRWQQSGVISRIGVIDVAEGLRIAMPDGSAVTHNQGYQHFNEAVSNSMSVELTDNNGE
ncbi:MAG: thiamine-phosphate kinase [Piscirickettsiaceae bacterium]|nr:MAG: thiamine-phosphate kinase [Piscirickettsiaceae bacterium]